MHMTSRARQVCAGGAAALLVACGGGEILAVLGFVGAGGGDFYIDADPDTDGLQRGDCGGQDCSINIQLASGQWADNYYTSAFAIRYDNQTDVPDCADSGSGRVDGDRIELDGCFSGRYVTVNEAVSDDGRRRIFFEDAFPDLSEGAWVEIQDRRRRFKFDPYVGDIAAGCELTTPASTPVLVEARRADFNAGRFESTITSFSIDGGAAYSGRFVGVSGLRLRRGGEVLELQREADATAACS